MPFFSFFGTLRAVECSRNGWNGVPYDVASSCLQCMNFLFFLCLSVTVRAYYKLIRICVEPCAKMWNELFSNWIQARRKRCRRRCRRRCHHHFRRWHQSNPSQASEFHMCVSLKHVSLNNIQTYVKNDWVRSNAFQSTRKIERKPEGRGAMKKKPNTAQQNRIDVQASNVKAEMSHTSD